ncbi:uncharacterized protein LOC115925223 [Strongylocentrotus purpuratus]|uniref:G-protein coupled receptors family 1 profile domain-containing protein n=1 Tax=Strongylocentrotus purpuratus TaxID=7668 RepID=A0A7M7P6U0_STRPU|nr:uncharacterized protein LOC115925223 [Strongylocentrotus purpuratus]
MDLECSHLVLGLGCNKSTTSNTIIFYLTLGIAFLLSTFTLAFILGHHRLRKRRFIFQFNIILADLVSLICRLVAIFRGRNFPANIIRAFLMTPLVVSTINILFVALYQLITIRVDPFGVKNIITTARCFVAAVASWVVCACVMFPIGYLDKTDGVNGELAVFILTLLVFLLTGVCLSLIYGVVAKMQCDNVQMEERKEDTKRVLRTFAIVYCTSLIAGTMTRALSLKLYVTKTFFVLEAFFNGPCFIFLVTLVTAFNWIANCVVYLWRLKEFRSIVFSCSRNRRVEAVY